MVTHHPDTGMLSEFSSGALPLAQSACVSLHLNYCGQCRHSDQRLQQLGASLFEELTPHAVDDSLLQLVMSRLDEEPPLTYTTRQVPSGHYPPLLQRLMQGDYDDMAWQRMSPALRLCRLRTGDPRHELALYHIRAGGSIPRHTHRGAELTLVLQGSFSDEDGHYIPGDFMVRDGRHRHSPMASRDRDCVCVGVLDAPISFTGWMFRLVNPFLRIQPH
jgi:putative transcriptional regulator